MYQKTEYLVKYKNGYLDPILSNVGLKQGCPLSPMLFNLYIDDIINIFDRNCEPIAFQGKDISHFMYADDLVLLSSSEMGLQTCLDKLHNFAGKNTLLLALIKAKQLFLIRQVNLLDAFLRLEVKTWNLCNLFVIWGTK